MLLLAAAAAVEPSCGARTGLRSESCESFGASVAPAKLDLFIMLDSSGSMASQTAEGIDKAHSVRNALSQFFSDPESWGIGVAIAFFPINRPEVPDYCALDSDCHESGACHELPKLCVPSWEKSCQADGDCAGTSSPEDVCMQMGGCENDALTLCLPQEDPSWYCTSGAKCRKLGVCRNRSRCDSAAYEKPVVEVSELPGARPKLLLAVDTHAPSGNTPSLPALSGALDAALGWQQNHAARKSVVVLATDGFPTACDPDINSDVEDPAQGIDKLVQVAEQGVGRGVQSFVVGVFAPKEESAARTNLSRIAKAGGTSEAFIITTDELVSVRLRETLNAIRTDAGACEFAIPWPEYGAPASSLISVRIPASGGAAEQTLTRRDSIEACDPVLGGFYFDVMPDNESRPKRVVLCPSTCKKFAPGEQHRVVVQGRCHVEL
ncbi:MAG: hypothetical protein HY898_10385 [Deltaproteobacteria bacterium]|nr:hypothetical protein [Deltaproteobacteria bacterium]